MNSVTIFHQERKAHTTGDPKGTKPTKIRSIYNSIFSRVHPFSAMFGRKSKS